METSQTIDQILETFKKNDEFNYVNLMKKLGKEYIDYINNQNTNDDLKEKQKIKKIFNASKFVKIKELSNLFDNINFISFENRLENNLVLINILTLNSFKIEKIFKGVNYSNAFKGTITIKLSNNDSKYIFEKSGHKFNEQIRIFFNTPSQNEIRLGNFNNFFESLKFNVINEDIFGYFVEFIINNII